MRMPATPGDTDWLQILTLYDVLLRWDDSPVVRLNRAVALGRVEGPSAALAEVDALRDALRASTSGTRCGRRCSAVSVARGRPPTPTSRRSS